MVKAASNVPLSNGSVSPPEWMKRVAGARVLAISTDFSLMSVAQRSATFCSSSCSTRPMPQPISSTRSRSGLPSAPDSTSRISRAFSPARPSTETPAARSTSER